MSKLISLASCILVTVTFCTTVHCQNTSENQLMPYFSAIVVKDAEKTSWWYKSVLGLESTSTTENPQRGSKIIVLASDNLVVELIEVKTQVKRENVLLGKPEHTLIQGFTKIGFRIRDLDAYRQKLMDLKVEFFGDVYTDPVSHKRSFLIQDPENNLIQIFE